MPRVNNQIVVIGASAGGIEAIRTLVMALPEDFAVPVCVTIHTGVHSSGLLAQIIDRAGPLEAKTPRSGESLRPGVIYVAPSDHHMVIEPGRVRLSSGPKENLFRPAIDPLFRTAAQVYGPGVIGVVLSGSLDDGTAGLWAVKQLGGTAVVQDPEDATFPDMPTSAIEHVDVDYVVRLSEMAPLLVELVQRPVDERRRSVPEHIDVEAKIARGENPIEAGLRGIGSPSTFSCPECHGVLMQFDEGGRMRLRCHTGHAYSVESLLTALGSAVEDELWSTVRALQELQSLLDAMAVHVAEHPAHGSVTNIVELSRKTRRRAEALRDLITSGEMLTEATKS